MQTALHIRSLVLQLKAEVIGARISATEFYKKERAAYFLIKGSKGRSALSFVYHPAGSGTFLVPASKVNITTREKPWPVFGLDGWEIVAVDQIGLDRIFRITVAHKTETAHLVFEAIGPNGNLWHLDSGFRRIATLRNREYDSSAQYEPPAQRESLDPYTLSAQDLVDLQLKQPGPIYLDRVVGGFNRALAIEAMSRASVSSVGQADPESLGKLAATIRTMAEMFGRDPVGYLHTIRGGLEAYPFKLSSVSEQPEKFKTLSLAVLRMVESRQTAKQEESEEKQITQAVSRAVKRLRTRIGKLESDITEAADFERFKKLGDLLQINLNAIKKGMNEVAVEDIYSEPIEEITITLDPALAPHENAERYFKKHRKGREGLELLERRLEISRAELEELEQMQSEFELSFESARQKYASELTSLLPREAGEKAAPIVRLPYREHTLSSGVTIYIGRDGCDNDRTTFEFARPYELWFHTQQCPGSHVVMKFPNKKFEPSKREIEETAAIAAYHSKAKNDSLVPVIYAERKYVRKPRKAKPGLVTVERERSVMVEPKKPE
jgi:predicted ribosome quality control (RQC) complex YloA/Tae2 family protein